MVMNQMVQSVNNRQRNKSKKYVNRPENCSDASHGRQEKNGHNEITNLNTNVSHH